MNDDYDPAAENRVAITAAFARIAPRLVIPQVVLARVKPPWAKRRDTPETRAEIVSAAQEIEAANPEGVDGRLLVRCLSRCFNMPPKRVEAYIAGTVAPVRQPTRLTTCAAPLVAALIGRDELELLSDVAWNKLHQMQITGNGDDPAAHRLARLSGYLEWLIAQHPMPEGFTWGNGDAVLVGRHESDTPDQLLALPPNRDAVGAAVPQPTYRLYARPGIDAPFGPSTGCQWPLWKDERLAEGHPFCGAPRAPQSSFCVEHHSACFIPSSRGRKGHRAAGTSGLN